MLPSVPPAQVTPKPPGWIADATTEFSVSGAVSVQLLPAVQPFASVMSTVWEPAPTLVRSSSVLPLLHANVKGAVPPVRSRSTLPSVLVAQLTLVPLFEERVASIEMGAGAVSVIWSLAPHPFASVTLTWYRPAPIPPMSSLLDVKPSPSVHAMVNGAVPPEIA